MEPGQSLRTDWPMRLIKGGDYRVVVSVTDRGGDSVFTSPTIQFHVLQKPVLQAGRVIPVAAGVPLLVIGLMIFYKSKVVAEVIWKVEHFILRTVNFEKDTCLLHPDLIT